MCIPISFVTLNPFRAISTEGMTKSFHGNLQKNTALVDEFQYPNGERSNILIGLSLQPFNISAKHSFLVY